jgi:hypothetical protein
MPLKTLLLAIITLLSFSVGVAGALAMPFRVASVELTIPISSGCGIGVHRGPYGGCNVIYGGDYRAHYHAYSHGYYDGYRDGYYDGSGRRRMVDQGACSGRHMYRVCNIYGTCWAVCN